jgi:hypothetical protein
MAQITISDQTPRVQYTIGSSPTTTIGAIPWPYFSTDDIKVYFDGTLKTISTHYTISGTAVDDGFSGGVVTAASNQSNIVVTVERDVAISRTSDFPTSGIFNIATLNTQLDKIFAICQWLETKIGRSASRPFTSTETYSLNWPDGATTTPGIVVASSDAGIEISAVNPADLTTATTAAASSATASASSATASASSASTASGHASTASTQATLATNYAVKVDGVAAGSDHSSKAWAVGGSGITDTSSKGASREWAIETSGTVDGTSYSSKEYALGVQGSNGGSAKQWALGGGGSYTVSTAVSGGLYSAKYHAAAALASAQAANSGQLYSEVVNKAVNFTVDNDDDGKYFIVDTSGGDRTVTLSAIGSNDGRRFAFQKTSAANDLIFDPQGSDRVNGSASNYLLSENSEVVILVAHNDDDDVLDYDNWIATIQSQTVAGAGLTKSGSSLSLNLAQDQSWTGSQRSTPVANTSGSFDMNTGNNFNYTPSGNQALTFTNITAGQGGILYVVNSGHTITKHASVKVDANLLATVSAAGTYMLGYYAPTSAIIVVTNSLAVT